MNANTTSSRLTLHAHCAFTHPLPALRIILLFVMLALLFSLSVPAAEPPNSTHPPNRAVSASPALRTSHARNSLRPQSNTGWYYADDSRHWYYQVPTQSTSVLTAAPPNAQDSSPLLKTGWHLDVDGFTYYFDPSDGHMLAGSHTIDGIEYSFLPERDRGNYHQDSLGAWFYRANGLAPYGSLLFSRSRGDRDHPSAKARPSVPTRDKTLIDSEDLVTDRITIPPKASPSELTRDDDPDTGTTATPSELPRDDDSTATPSEPPRSEDTPPAAPAPESPDPTETPDPETPDPPAPPSNDRDHAHTTDPSVHCIATDDWSTILANRDAYSECIEHHCTALLYLSGPPVSWPLPSTDTTTQDYPLYVSLVDAHDGQLTFAQAYSIPELSAVPMYVGTSLHASESTPTYKQTNAGGLFATWLFRTLVGTERNELFTFYLDGEDGSHTHHAFTYPGYQIRIPAVDEDHSASLLTLKETVKFISRGYSSENAPAEKTFYSKYLARKSWKENKLAQLYREAESKSSLWFPSAQELREYTLTKTEENTYLPLDDDGDPLLSIYLKSERYIPALADSWRSDESYWLRSTPSAYLSEGTFAEQGMSKVSTRDEYFLQADSTGNIRAVHYDATAAVRLIFTVK